MHLETISTTFPLSTIDQKQERTIMNMNNNAEQLADDYARQGKRTKSEQVFFKYL
jgi:hypothetical protein